MSTAHLYHALQNEGVLRAAWPDMELLIDLMGSDQIFHGDRPSNREEYSTQLSLLRGLSAETFARNRRDRGMPVSKRGRKFPFPKGDIIPTLKLRYFMTEKCPEATDEDSILFVAELEEELIQRTTIHSDGEQITIRARDNSQTTPASKAASLDQRKYSPIELLLSLQFVLARDLPIVMFDYLAFHKCCWDVLKCSYGVYGPILEQKMGPVGRMLDDLKSYRLPYSVDLMFSLGMPASKARKMIRKVAMPTLPPVTHEYQQMIDQGAIFSEVGKTIGNKIANGRLRVQANVRARKLIEARPEVVYFEIQTVGVGGGRITFKKHKMWQRKNAACTKKNCICGVKPAPMFNSGWRQAIMDGAGKLLGAV